MTALARVRRAEARPLAAYAREAELARRGLRCIAGIDEVGRGPLAGPVVAAAVILDPDDIPEGLCDSKILDREEREALSAAILARAVVSIASVSALEIDRINIRQATLLAMRRALAGLAIAPEHALVDGNDCPALPCEAEAIIGGDALVASIAAASIVAKVARDRMMARLGQAFPLYGFEMHAGYPTPAHRAALDSHGPCALHRYSFAPLKGRYVR